MEITPHLSCNVPFTSGISAFEKIAFTSPAVNFFSLLTKQCDMKQSEISLIAAGGRQCAGEEVCVKFSVVERKDSTRCKGRGGRLVGRCLPWPEMNFGLTEAGTIPGKPLMVPPSPFLHAETTQRTNGKPSTASSDYLNSRYIQIELTVVPQPGKETFVFSLRSSLLKKNC